MGTIEAISPKISPGEFGATYTQYYERETSDSPIESRGFLQQRLIQAVYELSSQINEQGNPRKVTILSIGSGRQILEKELSDRPDWLVVRPYVELFTLDIAALHQNQLLNPITQHIMADGSHLPLKSEQFDIVNTNMAIDFMPRASFSEVARILKPNGVFLANLHHPDLITIADSRLDEIRNTIRSCTQKLNHGKDSHKLDRYRRRLKEAQEQYNTVQFLLRDFPQLIFHSVGEIQSFFSSNFSYASLQIEEHQNRPYNGWFFLEAKGLQQPLVMEQVGIPEN